MYVCWRHAVLSIYVGRRISCYLRSRPACSDSGSVVSRRAGSVVGVWVRGELCMPSIVV